MAHASASRKDWDLQETTGRCIPNSSTWRGARPDKNKPMVRQKQDLGRPGGSHELSCYVVLRHVLWRPPCCSWSTQADKRSNGEITWATSRREKIPGSRNSVRWPSAEDERGWTPSPDEEPPQRPQRAQTWHPCAYRNQKNCGGLKSRAVASAHANDVTPRGAGQPCLDTAAEPAKFHEPGFCVSSGALVEAILRSIAGASVFRREEKTKSTADNSTDLTSDPKDKRKPGWCNLDAAPAAKGTRAETLRGTRQGFQSRRPVLRASRARLHPTPVQSASNPLPGALWTQRVSMW